MHICKGRFNHDKSSGSSFRGSSLLPVLSILPRGRRPTTDLEVHHQCFILQLPTCASRPSSLSPLPKHLRINGWDLLGFASIIMEPFTLIEETAKRDGGFELFGEVAELSSAKTAEHGE